MNYTPSANRYSDMKYVRCGRSGLMLPEISLGFWQNFGSEQSVSPDVQRQIVFKAFDSGITHLDLANNYGPPPGSAEQNIGRILATDLKAYRDELIVTSKAGHPMWEGPYGDWGSRKSLLASLDQSLHRTGLDYFDIFYSHRYDPNTPLEETMGALATAVKSGKALYAGISKYPADAARRAYGLLQEMGVPVLVHQVRYSMLARDPEESLFDLHKELGIGCVAFSPLAQGLLTDKYLKGIPQGSRAGRSHSTINAEYLEKELPKLLALAKIAQQRGQSLAQMAIAWQLSDGRVTSVLVGARSAAQLEDNLKALENTAFSADELRKINTILIG